MSNTRIRSLLGGLLYETHGGLTGKSLEDLYLRNADFVTANLQGVRFDGADLESASFYGSDLYWTGFFLANLTNADFSLSVIRGCNFRKANLSYARFDSSKLVRDNVGGFSDFRGADLRFASFENTLIEAAIIDSSTKFSVEIERPELLGFQIKE